MKGKVLTVNNGIEVSVIVPESRQDLINVLKIHSNYYVRDNCWIFEYHPAIINKLDLLIKVISNDDASLEDTVMFGWYLRHYRL